MRSRLSVTMLATLAILVAPTLAACGSETPANAPTQSPSQGRDIAGFLAEPNIPEDVKERFIAALDDGGLAPKHFAIVSGSWRRCSASCMGRVKSVTASSLTLEAMVDGREWTIGLSDATSITRGGRIFPSDLRNGEVVEALSQHGVTAQLVSSFSQ
jgi:hypothetical protein